MWKCDKTQIVMNLRRNWLSGVGGRGAGGMGAQFCSSESAYCCLCKPPEGKRREQALPLHSEPLVSVFEIKPQTYLHLLEIPNNSCPMCPGERLAM